MTNEQKGIEMNELVKRLLAHGVRVLPHQLRYVMRGYEKQKVPDFDLHLFSKDNLEKYVSALYLSEQEGAGDWTKGHKKLESLGFVRKEKQDGHRSFVSMVYQDRAGEIAK